MCLGGSEEHFWLFFLFFVSFFLVNKLSFFSF